MNKMMKILALILIVLFVISCGTGRISNLERKPDEAIILARIKIIDANRNLSKPVKIIVEEINGNSRTVVLDDSSFIYMKLKIGQYHLSEINGDKGSQILTKNLINFQISDSKIYYIGELYLLLQTDYIDVNSINYLRPSTAEIFVEDNYEEAIVYFTNLFPTDEIIYKSIANFDSTNKIGYLDFFKSYNHSFVKPDSLTKSFQRRNRK